MSDNRSWLLAPNLDFASLVSIQNPSLTPKKISVAIFISRSEKIIDLAPYRKIEKFKKINAPQT